MRDQVPMPIRGQRPGALIVGATAGLGRALANKFAASNYDLVLTGRDHRDLSALANDLRIRYEITVLEVPLDLATASSTWMLIQACESLATIDAVLLPAGFVRTDDGTDLSSKHAEEIVRGNFLGLAEVVHQVKSRLNRENPAVIVGFGSIAATRGRSRNVFYSAAKTALQTYFESLRHELQAERIRVQFYIPGYLDTGLAAGQGIRLPKARPELFAHQVVANLQKDFGTKYFPFWWHPLCQVLRLLPWFLFSRLRF